MASPIWDELDRTNPLTVEHLHAALYSLECVGSAEMDFAAWCLWLDIYTIELDHIESTCSGFYMPQAVEVRGG
jgi:hypothetical protein